MSKLEETIATALDKVTGKGTFTSKVAKIGSAKGMSTALYQEMIQSNIQDDPFKDSYSNAIAITPPVNPASLIRLINENSHLKQCADAMVVNVHGFGYRMEFISKTEKETIPEAQKELETLEAMFDSPNHYESFHALRQKVATDRQYTGNGYMEVVRNLKGEIIAMHHAPSVAMRITGLDEDATNYNIKLFRGGSLKTYKTSKFFRRYIQNLANGEKVFFKEFGDPRAISKTTGKEIKGESSKDLATEIIHFAEYNPKSPYGVPKWYTQLPSILGSREAELTNLDFFENNGIPAMAILISGGQLTEESFEEIGENFDTVKGRGSTNRIIILEARGALEDSSATGSVPTPTIQLKPLYAERQNDALFKEYESSCADKIRSAFRLPPVFIGQAADYSYASAKVSLEVAENQIFIPERVLFDDVINKTIVANMNPKYWRFRTNPAALATSEDLIKSIEAFNAAGAISPNTAINMLNEKLNMDIPRVEEFWGDLPFKMVQSILQSQASPEKMNFVNEVLVLLTSLGEPKTGTYPIPEEPKATTTTGT